MLEQAERDLAGSQRGESCAPKGQAGRAADGCSSASHCKQDAKLTGAFSSPSERRALAMMQRLHPTAVHLALRQRGSGGSRWQQPALLRISKPLPWSSVPIAHSDPEELPGPNLPGSSAAVCAAGTERVSAGQDFDTAALECWPLALSSHSGNAGMEQEVEVVPVEGSAARAGEVSQVRMPRTNA